jgi:hypothetical protein
MEPERAAAPEPPAPVVAPAVVPAGPVAAGPSGGLGFGSLASGNAPPRPTSPSAVLALQRAAGNTAVANLLQRQDKTNATGPGDFGVSGGEPKSAGTSQVGPAGDDKAKIVSPDVTFSGSVWLNDDKTLDQSANVGYIQNLANSDRGAVYRRGGTSDGEVVSEDHSGLSNKWDAVSSPDAEAKGKIEPNKGVYPPFYWQPTPIDANSTKDNPAKTDPSTHDRPEYSVPVKKGPGRLTEFKGKDQFKLGLGVKQGDAVWMLKAFDWSISWNAAVDANLNGAGEAVQSSQVKDAIANGPDVSLTDWSLGAKADVFEGFATVEEAMKRSASELLSWLMAAKAHDHTTYRNICAALDAKDPSFAIDVACESTNDLIGRDSVHVRAEGSGGGSTGRTVKLKEGESQSLSLGMKELFGSAGGIEAGARITVQVAHHDGPEGSAEFKLPFSGKKTMAVGSGRYSATLSLG